MIRHLLPLLLLIPTARAEETHFRERVAPILRKRCVECHNPVKSRGGLDLSSRAALLQGGDTGPGIIEGQSAKSLLIEQVMGSKPAMPRKGEPLRAQEVADLRKWIDSGASWPSTIKIHDHDGKPVVDANWWSLRPLVKATPPEKGNPIDLFIVSRLNKEGLKPVSEADRATLVRRLYFNLHGLPPTPEEMERARNDKQEDWYERLIDRLLDSPRYGERWGRHWLDVAHYADTHGYDKDKRRDHAWPYRDYVIQSFNDDKPYPQFVREQLAGDVLSKGENVVPTGFIAAGPWDFVGHVELREGTVEKMKTRLLDRDDMLSSTMSTFVSMTVHCARCHDHKFDPIAQADYYRLQAVFAGVERGDRAYSLPHAKVYSVLPRPIRPIHVLARGDVEKPGKEVRAGALALLKHQAHEFPNSDDEGQRRLALAEWVVDRDNVLTWRSIVNRVWHYHFGRGLVDTPNDFGGNGSKPTHPELLDWLACEFRDNGGRFKKLHRLILTSAAYRRSSRHDEANARIDADNRYLWRMNRRRLDAESIRDGVLSVSGKLDLTMGGPGYDLFRFKDDHSPVYDHTSLEKIHDPKTYRRTVYRFTVRSVPNPFLDCLDCADPNINTPVRNTTLTALQALSLLNNPFMVRQAEFFAERLKKTGDKVEEQIEQGYRLAFGRDPSAGERESLSVFAKKHGLSAACRLLLNANEFVFVD